MKYRIVPRVDYQSDVIEASSQEDALVYFATIMDMDMNIYFQVVPEKRWDDVKEYLECIAPTDSN